MEIKYIVYITVNLCNGKFYFGYHKTNPEVFDGYIGLGIYRQNQATEDYSFHRAVRKYGYENFKRTTLRIFDTEKEAIDFEAALVTDTVIKSGNCYNIQKGGFGGTGYTAKKVYQFALNGNFIKVWNSVKEAEMTLNLTHVSAVCRGERDSAGGFYWSYEKKFNYVPYDNSRKIAQYTPSGKFVRTWNSCKEAERELGIFNIHKAISLQRLCGEYQWRDFKGDTSDIPAFVKKARLRDDFKREINQYDKDGNFIKTWKDIDELEIAGFKKHAVREVLKGRQKTTQGYTFKLKDNDIVSSSEEIQSSELNNINFDSTSVNKGTKD